MHLGRYLGVFVFFVYHLDKINARFSRLHILDQACSPSMNAALHNSTAGRTSRHKR